MPSRSSARCTARRSLAGLLAWTFFGTTAAAESAPRLRLRKSIEDDGSGLSSQSVFNSTLAASIQAVQLGEDPWWNTFNEKKRPTERQRRKWSERQRRRVEAKVKDRIRNRQEAGHSTAEASPSKPKGMEKDPIQEKKERTKTFREKWGGAAESGIDHFKELRESGGEAGSGRLSRPVNGGRLDPAGSAGASAEAAGVRPVGNGKLAPAGTGRGPRQHGMVDPVGDGRLESAGRGGGGSAPLHVVEPTLGEPRVFLLFLADDRIDHVEHWSSFLDTADGGTFRTLVHCKQPHICHTSDALSRLPGITVVETVDTWYCHDLVSAMVQLLKYATQEEGASALDKFVFLSDSTLPVKPPGEVYGALTAQTGSDVCFFPKDHWAHAAVSGHRNALLLKHHQWVVLSRPHAQRMVDEWKAVNAQGHWDVPLQRESDPGGLYSAKDFKRSPNANWCTDEWGFFATLYGALIETRTSGDVHAPGFNGPPVALSGKRARSSQGVCRTFAFFSEDDPSLEALGRAIAKDHASRVSCWPVCTPRPMVFTELSDDAVVAMRQSDFLFARKFQHGAMSVERFQRIILAQDPPSESDQAEEGEDKGVTWW